MFRNTCSTKLGIAAPPEVPRTRYGCPRRRIIVGDAELVMRLPEAITFGDGSFRAKSCIALFSRNPPCDTTKPLPKSSPRLVVTAAMFPASSTMLKWVVCALAVTVGAASPSVIVGVARVGSIDARQ